MRRGEVYDLKNSKHLSDVQSYLELVKKELSSNLLGDKYLRDHKNNIDTYESLVSETLKNGVKKLTKENLKDYDKIEKTSENHIFKIWKGDKCGILYKDNIILEPTYDNILQIKGYVAVVKKSVEEKIGEENGVEKKHIILNLKNGRETEVSTRRNKLEPNKEIPCGTEILPYGTVFEDDGFGWGQFINSETGTRSSDLYRIPKHNDSGLEFKDYIVAYNEKLIDNKEKKLYEILDRNSLKPVYEINSENGEYYQLINIHYYDGVFKIIALDEKQNPKNTYLLYKNANGEIEKSKPYKKVEIYGNLAWIEEKNGEQYIINKNTQEKIYTLDTEHGEEIYYEYLCGFYIKRGEKFYIINVKTGEISEEGFDEIVPIEQSNMKKNKFINNSFIVRVGENYGIMSNECEYLLNLEYDFVGIFKNSTLLTNTVILFKEKGKDKYGFYNSFSGELVGKDYDGYFLYHDNIGLIKDGEIRFVDLYGNLYQESNGNIISIKGSFVLDVDETSYKATILTENGEIIIYDLPHKNGTKLSESKTSTIGEIINKYTRFTDYQKSYAEDSYLKTFKNIFEDLVINRNSLDNEIEENGGTYRDEVDEKYADYCEDMDEIRNIHLCEYLWKIGSKIPKMKKEIETFKKEFDIMHKNNKLKENEGSLTEYIELLNQLEMELISFNNDWQTNVESNVRNKGQCSEGVNKVLSNLERVYNIIKNIQKKLNISDNEIGYEDIVKYFRKGTNQ